MDRITVISSNLKSVGYNEKEHILEIEFQNMTVYQYFNVPPEIYDNLINASSKGKYHNSVIKDHFKYRRVS